MAGAAWQEHGMAGVQRTLRMQVAPFYSLNMSSSERSFRSSPHGSILYLPHLRHRRFRWHCFVPATSTRVNMYYAEGLRLILHVPKCLSPKALLSTRSNASMEMVTRSSDTGFSDLCSATISIVLHLCSVNISFIQKSSGVGGRGTTTDVLVQLVLFPQRLIQHFVLTMD